MWLSTAHNQVEGEASALENRYLEPFETVEMMRANAAKLALPQSTLIHPDFPVSLMVPFVLVPLGKMLLEMGKTRWRLSSGIK